MAAEPTRALQLEVFINDSPTHKIGSFLEQGRGRLAAHRAELAELGIKVGAQAPDNALLFLDDVPGIAYRYDEPSQSVYFRLDDRHRVANRYDARGTTEVLDVRRDDYGSVLNYSFFASTLNSFSTVAPTFSGANVALDGRVFGPFGTFSQSAIVGMTPQSEAATVLRLETYWRYSDPQSLLTYRIGDTISGGLAWTRPIRLGGFQVQRNFGLRPNLVTLPLPTLSGSAAVPSTVDVYVNNTKTLTQNLAAGPYEISNVPVPSDGGAARIVVRDATGQQTVTSLPFYTSPKLLRPGLTDFSMEVGAPRLNYGAASDNYGDSPVASLSLRGGLHDTLTVEGHAEGGAGLVAGGVGAVVSAGPWGLFSVAMSASHFDGDFGWRSYVANSVKIGPVYFNASMERTFGNFSDLASVTARYPSVNYADPAVFSSLKVSPFLLRAKPPLTLDTFSIGVPLPFDRSWLHASYLSMEQVDGTHVNLVNLSYTRPLFAGASLNANAYCDVSDRRSKGALISISIPLGDSISASTGVANSAGATNAVFEVAKSLRQEPGSFGWRIRDYEGSTQNRYAEAAYRSSIGEVRGGVQQFGNVASSFVQASGAVASMGGGVFLSNRIDDSFAVVKVGAPNVDVLYENRPIGRTNADGSLLVPNLRSYEANKIAIDPRGLPLEAEAPTALKIASPADRGGVLVDFGVKTENRAAVVIFVDKAGQFVAAGSKGRLEETNASFTVGYDGRAFIKDLGARNRVVISTERGGCRASFDFSARRNQQVVVGPVVCDEAGLARNVP